MPFRVSRVFSELNDRLPGFVTYVSANKARLIITDAQETDLTTQQTAWDAGWTSYNDESKQTMPVRHTQQTLYKNLNKLMNNLRQQVKNNASITLTDDDYAQLQLHRDKTTHTHAPKPTQAPVITLQDSSRLYVQLYFSYPILPEGNKRGLPPGVAKIEIEELISDTRAVPQDAPFLAIDTTGRSSIKLNFHESEIGKLAIFRARYQNSRGETGPWSSHRVVAILG